MRFSSFIESMLTLTSPSILPRLARTPKRGGGRSLLFLTCALLLKVLEAEWLVSVQATPELTQTDAKNPLGLEETVLGELPFQSLDERILQTARLPVKARTPVSSLTSRGPSYSLSIAARRLRGMPQTTSISSPMRDENSSSFAPLTNDMSSSSVPSSSSYLRQMKEKKLKKRSEEEKSQVTTPPPPAERSSSSSLLVPNLLSPILQEISTPLRSPTPSSSLSSFILPGVGDLMNPVGAINTGVNGLLTATGSTSLNDLGTSLLRSSGTTATDITALAQNALTSVTQNLRGAGNPLGIAPSTPSSLVDGALSSILSPSSSLLPNPASLLQLSSTRDTQPSSNYSEKAGPEGLLNSGSGAGSGTPLLFNNNGGGGLLSSLTNNDLPLGSSSPLVGGGQGSGGGVLGNLLPGNLLNGGGSAAGGGAIGVGGGRFVVAGDYTSNDSSLNYPNNNKPLGGGRLINGTGGGNSTLGYMKCCSECKRGDLDCLSNCDKSGNCMRRKDSSTCDAPDEGAYAAYCQERCGATLGGFAAPRPLAASHECRNACIAGVTQRCERRQCKDYGCTDHQCVKKAPLMCG
ncbi:hypothetical protein CSUI_004429 [Cystoisospora suis]|uniref:Uncharacterized protein n=1 Tax=Cystoisospora suis TaxID=483139 RepID=A0A2C6L0I2_9APIC|nr:hypothetical protein CSUI_004429 [Cystoisospora suis]